MTQRTSNQENSLPTSNEVTMLPCPFCGNTQATIFEHFKDAHYFYASCIGCDAEGPPALSSKEARDAWNQRGRSSHETDGERGGCRYPMSYGERCSLWPNCECGRPPEKASTDAAPLADRLAILGYAPGDYSIKCMDCHEFKTADKRALRCYECAMKRDAQNGKGDK